MTEEERLEVVAQFEAVRAQQLPLFSTDEPANAGTQPAETPHRNERQARRTQSALIDGETLPLLFPQPDETAE